MIYSVPSPTPIEAPIPVPEPEPEPVPEEEPVPIKKKTPDKFKDEDRPPKKRPPVTRPGKDAPEKEKREFVNAQPGVIARPRGRLNGKQVWLIEYWPYRKQDRMVLMGEPPAGAEPAKGKGSTKRGAVLLRGAPPKKPIHSDTGAVDDVITVTASGKVKIKHVKDPAVRRRKKTFDLGGGVEIDGKGRGHIKL